MTIKLAYITERDGLVFLCDKEGKELGQVVPKEANQRMLRIGMERGARGIYNEGIFTAMLSAAKVDVSAALVKVPQFIGIDPARPGAEQSVEVKYRIENGSVVIDALEGK